MEVSPISYTGGYGNHRFIHQASDHAGEGTFHASHDNNDPGRGQESILIEEAMQSCHPNVIDAATRTIPVVLT